MHYVRPIRLVFCYVIAHQGLLVVYDVTDEKSFNLATHWIQATRLNVGDAEIVLVGNKTDREDRYNGWPESCSKAYYLSKPVLVETLTLLRYTA
jgi:GTPase SAR1 family protein